MRAYAAWAAVCLIWGTTYLAIRISLETIPPFLMAAMRWIVAGGLLMAVLALRGERLPGPRAWPSLALLGVLLLGFGNGGVVWAEQTVPSGLTAVLVATSPFWMVGLDALMSRSRPRPNDSQIPNDSPIPSESQIPNPQFRPRSQIPNPESQANPESPIPSESRIPNPKSRANPESPIPSESRIPNPESQANPKSLIPNPVRDPESRPRSPIPNPVRDPESQIPNPESHLARRILGLLVGFGGIVMLVWPEIRLGGGGRGFLGGVVAAQIACVGWAIGSSYARRRGHTHAKHENVLATAAFEMLFGGVVLLVLGLAMHETSRLAFTSRTAGALVYLTFVGSIGGFTAYAYALKHLPVVTVSLYAYVNPIIAVVLGALVLHEPFDARMAIAAAVVLIGLALVRGPNT